MDMGSGGYSIEFDVPAGTITNPRRFGHLGEALDYARRATTGPWRIFNGEELVAIGVAKKLLDTPGVDRYFGPRPHSPKEG
jgi:hypothetical protein